MCLRLILRSDVAVGGAPLSILFLGPGRQGGDAPEASESYNGIVRDQGCQGLSVPRDDSQSSQTHPQNARLQPHANKPDQSCSKPLEETEKRMIERFKVFNAVFDGAF